MSSALAPDAATADCRLRWQCLAEASPQLRTQAADPSRWSRFYDRVAPLWDAVTAGVDGLGHRIAAVAREREVLRPNDDVVEVGCGTGGLALAMVEHGARVTAVDASTGMIGVLREKLRTAEGPDVSTAVADWRRLPSERRYQLAAACCVPDTLSPDGLQRLDRLSRRHCLLVLGHGTDVFPLRRRIWRRAMDEPLPPTGQLLPFVMSTLETMGRRPRRASLSWPAQLDVAADDVRAFFEAYFLTLGCTGDDLDRGIHESIARHVRNGRVRCSGMVNLTAVWWRAGSPTNGSWNPD